MTTRIDTLFQRFIDGNCTRQEYEELMDLLQQNSQEEKFHALLNQVYQVTTRSLPSGIYVDNNGDLQTTGNMAIEEAPVVPAKRRKSGLAVVILIVVLSGIWFYYHRSPGDSKKPMLTESTVKKFTERAEQKKLLLPDSTQVWLNVASTLEFPENFSGPLREVYLTGEAFFDIKHGEDIPFVIHTGAVTTRVTGKAVNVKAYPDQQDVEVKVKSGKVQVSKNDKLLALLTAGQQVKVGNEQEEAPVLPINKQQIADWIKGRLSYDSIPVADIVKDFERIYNVTIDIRDSTANATFVTTSFRRDIGIEQALQLLCNITGTELSKENDAYIVNTIPTLD